MTDKRAIVANKRARNKRKKAMRSSAKALAAQIAADEAAPHDAPTDSSSGEDEPKRREEEEEEEEEDDDELVFVCRPILPGFCTEFVLPDATGKHESDSMRKFSVRIPAFRDTREGYTTYSIIVALVDGTHRQFQVERRYSEFVAFAAALEEYFNSEHYEELKRELATVSSAFRLELPPKTWFRMTQTTALEERRSKLEASLHTLLAHDPKLMCNLPTVRDFLMLDIFGAQVAEEKTQCV